MPVPSTITDLSDSAASNFPQDSDSTGSTVASLPRNLSAIIKKQFIRGSDVAVVSSGSVTLNTEYSYFVVTGSGYNITGFSDAYNGRKVTLKFSGALTLVNSASLILPSGSNITTAAGDVFEFVNESSGVWRCIQSTGNGLTATNATNASQLGGVAAASYALLASPALTGNPTAPTPAQFDNDTSVATTAFVQRALGNIQSVNIYGTGTTALTAATSGNLHVLGQVGTIVTLPLLSTVIAGSVYKFWNGTSNGSATVQRNGTDLLYVASNTVASIAVNGGEFLTVVATTTGWYAMDGSAVLGAASSAFGSSLAADGYQKLPSGLIIQWGTGSVAATGSYITLPIAFPNAFFKVLCGVSAIAPVGVTANNNVGFQASPDGLTRFAGRYYQDSVGYPSSNFHFIAIGY